MGYIDKYQVIEEIGRGGMGAVYKALHPQFKKFVAIKEIRADLASNPEVQRRFEQEIEVLAQLPPHPNIVTVRDALVWEGKLYIILDYIEGQNLSQLIRAGFLEPDRGAILLDRVLSGLEAIHSRGIVHRDLKSGNILMDCDGNAFITDFGIAEFTNELANKEANAVVMATPRYAAPELIDPRLRGNGTDQQLDIYAAGVLSYETLLGETRFREAFPEVYNRASGTEAEKWLRWHLNLNQPARKLNEIDPQISAEFARIISRMMAKDVKQRYRTVQEARRELLAMMRRQRELQTQKEVTFDQTIAFERPQGGGLTNVVGPETAALYETYALHTENTRSPEIAETIPARRLNEPLEMVTKDARAPETVDVRAGESSATSTTPQRKPVGIYVTVGALLLLLVIAGAWLLLMPKTFTLVVRGAPAGSTVFVDNQKYGVTATDGTLRIADLSPGKRSVLISLDGHRDFSSEVDGKSGAEQVVIANLEKMTSSASSTSGREIDYNGDMILIPEGPFFMGDDRHELNEQPTHRITLADFYIDKYEVTNAQYKRFCDETNRPYPTETKFNKDYFANHPNKPVVGVSWQDAADYAKWAGKRLPTEEEWEKAASWDPAAQKKRQFPWGDDADTGRANVNKSPEFMADVGSFLNGASAYGVMDMAGNASEWVESFYQPYSGNQTADADFGITKRVIRGGDVVSPMDNARTTRRQYAPPGLREYYDPQKGKDFSNALGFRCAISASDPRLPERLKKQ